jgi:hypothetical protein
MSYTTDLAIELQVTGTNAGTWGQITNIAGGAQTTALCNDAKCVRYSKKCCS